MKINEKELEIIEAMENNSRAKTMRIARSGLPELADNASLHKRKKEAAQYRACVALLWNEERILEETGWSIQKFYAVKKWVKEQDKRINSKLDPRTVFGEYKVQQFQAAQELEDLCDLFKNNKNYSTLVQSIKARSDILDKIIKTGQELGVIKRQAKEINTNINVDYKSMSLNEMKIYLKKEIDEVNDLFEPEQIKSNNKIANNLLNKILSGNKPPQKKLIEAKARKIKVKKIKRKSGN